MPMSRCWPSATERLMICPRACAGAQARATPMPRGDRPCLALVDGPPPVLAASWPCGRSMSARLKQPPRCPAWRPEAGLGHELDDQAFLDRNRQGDLGSYGLLDQAAQDRKSTRLNSSHV